MTEEIKKAGGEDIVIKKEALESLLDRIAKLEQTNTAITTKPPKRVMEREVYLRMWDEQLVVNYNTPKEVRNERTMKDELLITLFLKSGAKETKVSVDYLKFLNEGPKVKAKVLSSKAEERIESSGVITTSPTDPMFYRETGKMFNPNQTDLEVKFVDYTYEVEIIEGDLAGEKLSVNSSLLNI